MTWTNSLIDGEPEHEREVVDRFAGRLIALARERLPAVIRQRVDPEDVVQSVYRSFFRRLRNGEFAFDESHDVWRLLAVMTFHKVRNVAKHHRRDRRDATLDVSLDRAAEEPTATDPSDHAPTADDLAIFVEYLDRMLAELPEQHHRIVMMRLEGHSIADIAVESDVSRRTVLRVMAHIRKLAGRLVEADS